MREGWEYKQFTNCVLKVPKQKQVKSKDYLQSGMYPIVSQEAELISGYYDNEAYLYHHEKPIVVFGDHTKNVKYIDFDFVVGADGTQLLYPIDEIESKYFYYVLKSIKLRDLGYARHFKLLKQELIPVPPLTEQQSIVSYLDSSFSKIDAMKANASKALEEAKALFQATLKEMLEPKEGWEDLSISDIAQIKGGKRIPKGYKLQSEPTSHKYIRVADFLDCGTIDESNIQYITEEIYNQIKNYTITSNDVYVSIAGTIGKSGIIPKSLDGANLTENACKLVLTTKVDKRFVYYQTLSPIFIKQMLASTKVSAQPKLALTRLASIRIAVPPLPTQHSIVTTLDSLKSKVDQLQANYEKIVSECDALKQAILRQVFE